MSSTPSSLPRPLPLVKLSAWAVHLYTAMGLVIAGSIIYCLVSDDPDRFRQAFVLMLIATVIDATDGFFARKVRVKEVLPGFDGRRLDDITDFLNYTFLPLFLIYEAGLLPEGQQAWLFVPLVASAYGFCQVSAKTDDGFFLGFPSYWNLVAFYLYALQPPGWMTIALLIALSLLTFIPMRYLYPTQPGRLNRLSLLLGAVWAALLVLILWAAADRPLFEGNGRHLMSISLFYPVYYLLASWVVSARYWHASRLKRREARLQDAAGQD